MCTIVGPPKKTDPKMVQTDHKRRVQEKVQKSQILQTKENDVNQNESGGKRINSKQCNWR